MIKRVSTSNGENKAPVPVLETPPRRWADRLSRNVALAGMILLSILAVRNEQLPSGQTVLTAVQELIEPNWGESLGKISFVGRFFPDTVSVFFDPGWEGQLVAPCAGSVTHPWSREEPYLGFSGQTRQVFAAADGEIMSVAHGEGEERILRIRHSGGMETVYYHLTSVQVAEGDPATTVTCLGEVAAGTQALMEVRRAGRAIDPTAYLAPRSP